jgi:DNA-binding response OmpR family regulator
MNDRNAMTHSRRVLVVSKNYHQRDQLVRWLASDGYDPIAVGEFQDARRELDTHRPDLLVADVKLDAYNGLHLAIWGRGKGLTTRSILIGEPDLVLQKEAERERAAYLTPPLEQKAFLTAVASLLSAYKPARRSPRKKVALEVTVDGVLASLIDLSYEGLRLQVRNAQAISLPSFFTLQIPSYDVVCRVQRVWTGRPSTTPDVLWCGAVLPASSQDEATTATWRHFVDAVPEESSGAGRDLLSA